MNLTIIEQPPFEAVSLQQCYDHLRLDTDGSPPTSPDDALLSTYIAASRIYAENVQQASYVQRTVRLSLSVADMKRGGRHRFGWIGVPYPEGYWRRDILSCGFGWIDLPRPPLGWVVAVSYYDADNVLNTVDESDYYTTDDLIPQLRFVSGFSLSAISHHRDDAIRIDYIAGYLPTSSPAETQDDYTANIPQNIQAAILLGVQILYDQPSGVLLAALTAARDSLLDVDDIPVIA